MGLIHIPGENEINPDDLLSKKYYMKFSDGSTWVVPVHVIAMNRAEQYAGEYDDVHASLVQDTLPLFAQNPDEITDWAKNNMNWADVEHEAVQIRKPNGVNYQSEWVDCEVIIR